MKSLSKSILLALGMIAVAAPSAAAPRKIAVAKAGLVPAGANILFVSANAVPGQEAEFHRWYDGHMQDIIKLPGFVRAQRFEMQPRSGRENPPYRYMILYEFNGSPDAVIAALGPAVKAGRLELPDKRFVLKTETVVYKAVHPGFVPKK